MTLVEILSTRGFDPVRLRFGFRIAGAACLALTLSWLMGLEHPQWSAMTVWVASQPTPGPLVEKGFFRAAGSVIGAATGVLFVIVCGGHPTLLLLALAAWVGICVGIGNVLRGFVSYGALMAGGTAPMVAMLNTAHPGEIVALGVDRGLTVLVGVFAAVVIGLLFGPRKKDELSSRSGMLAVRLLRAMAQRTATAAAAPSGEEEDFLREMAAIEGALDPHGMGSLRSRRSAKTLRAVLHAQMAALLWLKSNDTPGNGAAVAGSLLQAADAIDRSAPAADILVHLEQARQFARTDERLHGVIAGLADALRDRLNFRETPARPSSSRTHVVLHRDWIGAGQAMVRATAAMLFAGSIWLLTGWQGGPYLLLGTAVMISLFSTFDSPASIMRHVLIGQALGAATALVCRWLIWPSATADWQLVVLMFPFILIGILPYASRRFAPGGVDYNMVMLLLLQPDLPLEGTFGYSVTLASAVVAAPAAALLAFRLVFPIDPRKRLRLLTSIMVRELQAMAADRAALARAATWRARLTHRLLTMTRWLLKIGEAPDIAIRSGLVVMQVGESILDLHKLADDSGMRSATRQRIKLTLDRMTQISREPERVGKALERLAAHLQQKGCAEADLHLAAGRAIVASGWFFRSDIR